MILAHELTHALEDQHFNLLRLPLEAKGNDDRSLAASALVEGDATLVMNQYLAGNLSASVLKDSLASALTTDVRQLAAAPRFLRETLLFPYLHGLEFCQTLYERNGWDALAEAFEHPPASTSEILHPERFPAQPIGGSSPVSLFADTTIAGKKPIADNVLGEFGIRQLFAAWLRDDLVAGRAADGWKGDHYLVYGDSVAASYIWRTCWADPEGARRFAAAMKRCLILRYKGATTTESDAGSKTFRLASPAGGRSVSVDFVSATEVVVIDAQDEKWFSALQNLQFTPAGQR